MKTKWTLGVSLVAGLLLLVSPMAQAQTWSQSWSDEFNGSGAAGGSWGYDVGGGGWGNSELEYYTSGSGNAVQTGGVLQIQARFQSMGGMPYTSARLKTQGIRNFGPGEPTAVKIEGRMQGPNGQGYWPAFWMLGSNITSVPWPACGEIDIMEHVNTATTVPMTLHWDYPAGAHSSYTFGNANVGGSFTSMHTYAITWDANAITGWYDGGNIGAANIAGNINGTEEFHRSFFLIMNLAVGGSWPGNPVAGTVFPANFNLDYVRYFTAGGGGGATPTNPPSATPTPTPSGGGGSIANGGIYQVINKNSNKCVDSANGSAANGNVVQQWGCNGSGAQKWQFGATDSGFYKVGMSSANNQVWDVSAVSTADGAKINLWAYGGGGNQQWKPVSEAGGYYHFTARHDGKCLDVPSASTADGVQLQQWACNSSAAQAFRVQ